MNQSDIGLKETDTSTNQSDTEMTQSDTGVIGYRNRKQEVAISWYKLKIA